jgi:hypothetical protein
MNNNIYISKIFNCRCGNNTFTSSGFTISDKYMVEDDELTCNECGDLYTVYCDDGSCSLVSCNE